MAARRRQRQAGGRRHGAWAQRAAAAHGRCRARVLLCARGGTLEQHGARIRDAGRVVRGAWKKWAPPKPSDHREWLPDKSCSSLVLRIVRTACRNSEIITGLMTLLNPHDAADTVWRGPRARYCLVPPSKQRAAKMRPSESNGSSVSGLSCCDRCFLEESDVGSHGCLLPESSMCWRFLSALLDSTFSSALLLKDGRYITSGFFTSTRSG